MTTLQLDISPQQLLQAISRLETPALDKMADEISLLRGRRHAPSLSKTESELLNQISAANLSIAQRKRLHELGVKMERHDISEVERQELLTLSDRSEALNVQRLQAVSDLAALRGQSFIEVMNDLGLINSYGA